MYFEPPVLPIMGKYVSFDDSLKITMHLTYAHRHKIVCRKLVQEQLYTASSIILSPRSAFDMGEYSEMSEMTDLKAFVSELAGHVAPVAARR